MKMMSWVLVLATVSVILALAGIPQPVASAVDTTPPTGTIIINSNRSATNTPNVTLALTWSDGTGLGVSRMRFSNDGATWSAWEVLQAVRPYTLPGGDGHKTVRVQYLDKANNRSITYSDYIRLDTTPPTGTIIINGGASTTTSQAVTLGLAWSDGTGAQVSRMRFSDNGSTWTAWMAPAATREHTLPLGQGYHTVRVQYLDGANNYSTVYSDYIKLLVAEETVLLPGNVPLVMVRIPGGSFMMGHYPGEQDYGLNEGVQHAVTLNGFWMGKYELTKRQWTAVMGTAPWTGQDHVLADLDSPAVYVSWDNAQVFIAALNSYTGKTFRLPSEAEWEHACRAGTTTRFYWGDDPGYTVINDYAWWIGNAYNAGVGYARVGGQKLQNPFGLYDMSGNVWEWCEDDMHGSYAGAPTDGQAWIDSPRGDYRATRGGAWGNSCELARSAYRASEALPRQVDMSIGFRLVGTL